MSYTPDLNILFPTNFSDACFRTGRAIAQLADNCNLALTIAHVIKPGASMSKARRELHSFLGEADSYGLCHRTLIESDSPVRSLAALSEKGGFDLILAPASDRLGLHRLVRPSFRGRLLKECKAPLWTAATSLYRGTPKPSIRTIACVIDFDVTNDSFLPLAIAFANRVGARFRLVHVVPPVHEGTLARSLDSDAPLMPKVAMDRLRKAFAGHPAPDIDVVVGERNTELPRLLCDCDADLAFFGPGQAIDGFLRPGLAKCIDRLPCPAICVDCGSAEFGKWTFQHAPAQTAVRTARRPLVPAMVH